MHKPLYIGFSLYEFIQSLVFRIICVIGLIVALSNYAENPPVIRVLSVVLISGIIIFGNNQLIVYDDRISLTTNSFASLIFNSRATTIQVAEIKLAYLEARPASKPADIAAAAVLAAVLPVRTLNKTHKRSIFFEMKNGEILQLQTDIPARQLSEIVGLVNSLLTAKPGNEKTLM